MERWEDEKVGCVGWLFKRCDVQRKCFMKTFRFLAKMFHFQNSSLSAEQESSSLKKSRKLKGKNKKHKKHKQRNTKTKVKKQAK